MPRPLVSLAALALALVPAWGPPALARDVGGPTGPAPAKNFSNIHADVDWVRKAFKAATEAAGRGAWAEAARTLQGVVDARTSRESPPDAAPYVRAVQGTRTYEGAWIVARHMIAAWGAEALEAYRQEFEGAARTALERAVARRDTRLLRETAERFLPLAPGRRAALLLADEALERGDADGALGWIEMLEDLESASAEPEEALAPWREARIARHAQALARDGTAVAAVRKAIAASPPTPGQPVLDRIPAALRRQRPPASEWLTAGGDRTRAALAPSVGARLKLAWFRGSDPYDDLVDSGDPLHDLRDRPSVWLPPRAVATRKHLLVSDGAHLHVYDIETGARVFERGARTAYPGGSSIEMDGDEDRRIRFGLLEGHTLSLHPVRDFHAEVDGEQRAWSGPGYLVLCAVPDGDEWPIRLDAQDERVARNDHIQAYYWNDDEESPELTPIWRAGGLTRSEADSGIAPDTRLYGGPIVYRGRVWVGGVRPAKATADRWEAWVFGLDPHTGRALSRTHVGTGTPVRVGRMDEVIPTSPAAAHGRVIVGTALGMIAALDAYDGRIRWIYRYDRAVETERGVRRNRNQPDVGQRASSFANEPPILAEARCYVAPTDSNKLLILHDRPLGAGRSLLGEDRSRMIVAWFFMAEHIAGVAPARDGTGPQLVVVGKGEDSSPPGPLVTAVDALLRTPPWPDEKERALRVEEKQSWSGVSPTGFGPEPYGRALVTAEEVFVPTWHGIAIYELADRDGNGTHYLGVLNRQAMLHPEPVPEDLTPYGNLIPVPGRGIAAVSATTVAFWVRR